MGVGVGVAVGVAVMAGVGVSVASGSGVSDAVGVGVGEGRSVLGAGVVTARSKGLVGPTVSPPGLPMGWLQVAVKVTAGDCACELKSPNVEPIGERLSTIEPTAPRIRA
jgi:hypothetical protein